jgi:alginate O-acetyltransferase complex protein AlgI
MYIKVELVLLIVLVVLTNFFIGKKIGSALNKVQKRNFMYLSLTINLGILIYFKYWNFFIENVIELMAVLHLKSSFSIFEIILPLGLSYYIFQLIGYNIDIYRGSIKAENDLSVFGIFVLFFPKLLVGPIERAKNLLPQFKVDRVFNPEYFIEGSKQIIWGLFKKLVIADRISLYVDAVYSNLPQHNSSTFLVSTLLYPIQVYADFSGYTDIALGTAKLFGINLIDNFKRPFFARNVSDFWRRWHISLSSWVNDYIYNPIVFKYRDWGNKSIYFALILSFVTIGIWHGASWNFVLFGLLQAFALIVEVLTRKIRKQLKIGIPALLYNNLSILLTYLFFAFSLVIFRTTSYSDAFSIINIVKSGLGPVFIDQPSTFAFVFIGITFLFFYDFKEEYSPNRLFPGNQKKWVLKHVPYALMIIIILISGVFDGGQFIYFAF